MKVIKALNNNMVLVQGDDGVEKICQGKGIGFGVKSGDVLEYDKVERTFIPANSVESNKFQELFSEIPDDYFRLGEKIIEYARENFAIKVSQGIILPLCDHMAGSVERYKKGVVLSNPMLWDVKRVYPKEFKTGKYALELLKEYFGVEEQEDEAAFIAYHFVNAELDNMSPGASPEMLTMMIGEIIDILQKLFQITLDENDWNYQRFLTHLKFFVNRMQLDQSYGDNENDELFMELKEKYPHVYQCEERIADHILIKYHHEVSREERLYLLIHIERVTRKLRKKG